MHAAKNSPKSLTQRLDILHIFYGRWKKRVFFADKLQEKETEKYTADDWQIANSRSQTRTKHNKCTNTKPLIDQIFDYEP